MDKFAIEQLELPNLMRIKFNSYKDDRGEFSRLFCSSEMKKIGWNNPIAQINKSINYEKGTVRGLHYQKPPYAEKKIIMCESGAIWDIAVDIRRKSRTFLQYHVELLSQDSKTAIMIPEGFAHGFQALENNTKILYFHSEFYSETFQDGLNVNDPALAIRWPLEIKKLSSRDRLIKLIDLDFIGIDINEM